MISSTWLPGWPRVEAPESCIGQSFAAAPRLIVLHSGDRYPGVAEYFRSPGTRRVSAHFAWSNTWRGLVQMVPLDREAMHAGCGGRAKCIHHRECTGRYEGQRVNAISWGIELPGPWDQHRDEDQMRELMALLSELRQQAPIEAIAAHSAICLQRRDPGPGLDWERLKGLGLEVVQRG